MKWMKNKGSNFIKSAIIIVMITLLLWSFAGCGKKPSDSVPTPTPTIMPTSRPTEMDDTIVVVMPGSTKSTQGYGANIPVPEPPPGETPLPRDIVPITTNPYLVESRDLMSLYNLVFESLVEMDDQGHPVPSLAKSWSVDDSGTKWTFVLRDGVVWHQTGREINAQDVHFTITLMQKIKGYSKHCQAIGYMKDWDVIDQKTILIETYEPFYGILHAMDFPVLPSDVGYTELGGEPIVPVGTGPYRVTAFDVEKGITLKLNPKWWQIPPTIQTIRAEIYDNIDTATSALSLRQLDVIQTDDITVSQLRESSDVNTYEYVTNYYEYLLPNLRAVELKDERIRRAIAHALDRQQIVSNVYINHAILVDTPVPPNSWLYEGKLLTYNNNIQEAKRLLNLAGWKQTDDDPWLDVSPEGVERDFKITILTSDDGENPQRYEAAQLISDQLAKIGINVEVVSEGWDVFQRKVSEGRFDLLLAGWYLSDIPDLRFALGSERKVNLSGYIDDEMDVLLEDVMKQHTEQGIKAAYDRLQQKIIEDVPIISLYFRTHTLLTQRRVTNVTHVGEGNAFSSIGQWKLLEQD